MKIKPEDLKNYIGKKITWSNWDRDIWCVPKFVGDSLMIVDKNGEERSFTIYHKESFWETYEEPKKKVKLEQWIFKNGDGRYEKYTLSERLFLESDDVPNRKFTDGVPIKCIATYEVDE